MLFSFSDCLKTVVPALFSFSDCFQTAFWLPNAIMLREKLNRLTADETCDATEDGERDAADYQKNLLDGHYSLFTFPYSLHLPSL